MAPAKGKRNIGGSPQPASSEAKRRRSSQVTDGKRRDGKEMISEITPDKHITLAQLKESRFWSKLENHSQKSAKLHGQEVKECLWTFAYYAASDPRESEVNAREVRDKYNLFRDSLEARKLSEEEDKLAIGLQQRLREYANRSAGYNATEKNKPITRNNISKKYKSGEHLTLEQLMKKSFWHDIKPGVEFTKDQFEAAIDSFARFITNGKRNKGDIVKEAYSKWKDLWAKAENSDEIDPEFRDIGRVVNRQISGRITSLEFSEKDRTRTENYKDIQKVEFGELSLRTWWIKLDGNEPLSQAEFEAAFDDVIGYAERRGYGMRPKDMEKVSLEEGWAQEETVYNHFQSLIKQAMENEFEMSPQTNDKVGFIQGKFSRRFGSIRRSKSERRNRSHLQELTEGAAERDPWTGDEYQEESAKEELLNVLKFYIKAAAEFDDSHADAWLNGHISYDRFAKYKTHAQRHRLLNNNRDLRVALTTTSRVLRKREQDMRDKGKERQADPFPDLQLHSAFHHDDVHSLSLDGVRASLFDHQTFYEATNIHFFYYESKRLDLAIEQCKKRQGELEGLLIVVNSRAQGSDDNANEWKAMGPDMTDWCKQFKDLLAAMENFKFASTGELQDLVL